ncbi:MAG: lipid-transfer protein [Acidimicrobiia bacterium]
MTGGNWLRDKAAFVGFGHTRYGRRGELGDNGPVPLVIEAVEKAAEDAGISPADIDGYSSYSNDSVDAGTLASAFGSPDLRFTAMGWGGGGGAMGGAYMYAAMAVATGQANYVAITRGVVQGGQFGNRFGGMGRTDAPRFPGLQTPGQSFALAARRHMHVYGTTIDHFGEIAINARRNAANNPDARFREEITMEDHHESRMICDPLRLLDHCMESDSGSCVILTSAERAKDLKQPPVHLAGVAMGAPYRWGAGMFGGNNMSEEDFMSAGQRTIADDLYANAGMGPDDIDVALIYDHFTPMVLMGLEDFQLCPKGESGPFVADGNIRREGSIPVNTHGGNLAEVYNHGMSHVYEGMRQLRGTSTNQIDGAEVALVVAGSSPTPSSALLLRKG